MKKTHVIFFLIPFLYLLLLLFGTDSGLAVDLGRQIKMGEIINQCHCVPQTNTFSLMYPDFPAINHSWLSGLLFFKLTALFGLTSLLYLKCILIIASFMSVYILALKKEAL